MLQPSINGNNLTANEQIVSMHVKQETINENGHSDDANCNSNVNGSHLNMDEHSNHSQLYIVPTTVSSITPQQCTGETLFFSS